MTTECCECGTTLSDEYERVMADNQGNAECPACRGNSTAVGFTRDDEYAL